MFFLHLFPGGVLATRPVLDDEDEERFGFNVDEEVDEVSAALAGLRREKEGSSKSGVHDSFGFVGFGGSSGDGGDGSRTEHNDRPPRPRSGFDDPDHPFHDDLKADFSNPLARNARGSSRTAVH